MAKNQNIEGEIRSLVDSFVNEISVRVRQAALDSLRQAIEGSSAAPARRGRRPGRPARAATPAPAAAAAADAPGRRGRKPSAASMQAAADLEAFVGSNPGLRLEEIGAALRQATAGLKGPMARLVRDGIVRTEGQRRGTRYFPGSGKPAGKKRGPKPGKKAGRKGKKGRRGARS
ncbi:MAG: hypothetical protein IPJ19_09345 [Planctomycetes bacterium]|nr:hypothetical protein [Planctomycetota bacterium]